MEKRAVLRSAFVVGGFPSLSRLLGMVRDLLTAGVFGLSLPMSAFVVAFRIPNLFRRMFGEGALSSAFIPVFVETREREGDAAGWEFANRIISLVTTVLVMVALAGMLVMTLLIPGAEPGSQKEMIYPLTRLMLPYMLFICLAALSMGMLNSYHHFAVPAFTPSLLNITWILALVFLCPRLGDTPEEQIFGLAWGVLVAGLLQLAFQVPVLRRYGYRPQWSFAWRDPKVIRVFLLMGPATLGLAITQINVMVNSLLAVWIGPWAPAALFYSERLLYFPQGILATAMSTVLLPVFARQAARADRSQLLETMNHSLRVLWFVMAPAALGLLVLARPIVQMLFEWGRFDETSTELTGLALQCYAPGLLIFSLAKIFVPAFYAQQDMKTPVKVGVMCVLLNLILNIVFLLTLPLYWKHAGLAFATVIAELVNGVILGWYVHRRMGSPGWKTMLQSAARALGAAVLMAVTIYLLYPVVQGAAMAWIGVPKLAQIASVMTLLIVGMGVFTLAAWMFRCPEIEDILNAMKRRREGERIKKG